MHNRSGAFAMGLIDLFANCVICLLVGIMIGVYGYRTVCGVLSGAIFLIIIANLLLLCGLGGSCGILIGAWQIVMFLYILILLMGWILIPLIFVIDLHPFGIERYQRYLWYIDDIRIDIPPLHYLHWGAIMLAVLILPIYYTYFWIVVNSYRRSLSKRRKRGNRLGVEGGEDPVLFRNAPVLVPQQYTNPAYLNTQRPMNMYGEQSQPAVYTQDTSIAQPVAQWPSYDAQPIAIPS